MKIELIYRIVDKKGSLIDFDAFIAQDRSSLNSFILEMYEKVPSFTDRSSSFSITKKEVDISDIFDIVENVFDFYGTNDIKLLFEINSFYKRFLVSAFGEKQLSDSVLKKVKFNGHIDAQLRSSRLLELSMVYFSSINRISMLNLKKQKLNKSCYAVACALAESDKPLSRQDIEERVRFKTSSISKAFVILKKDNIIKNVNKTKSPRLNAYILNDF